MRDNAWISILGIYKWDPNIFDDMQLPKAADLDLSLPYMLPYVEDLSEDTLQFKILTDLAELPLVYTDPELLKYAIGRWSRARKPVWRELWKTTLYKYSPIWNKDGSVTETRNLDTTGSASGSLRDSTSASGTLDREVKHDVTGFDSDSYAADTRDIVDEESSTTGSLDRSTNDQTRGNERETISRVEQGNIGVTSTQSMIREQREIVLLDMYQIITDEFKKQFCIMIY